MLMELVTTTFASPYAGKLSNFIFHQPRFRPTGPCGIDFPVPEDRKGLNFSSIGWMGAGARGMLMMLMMRMMRMMRLMRMMWMMRMMRMI